MIINATQGNSRPWTDPTNETNNAVQVPIKCDDIRYRSSVTHLRGRPPLPLSLQQKSATTQSDIFHISERIHVPRMCNCSEPISSDIISKDFPQLARMLVGAELQQVTHRDFFSLFLAEKLLAILPRLRQLMIRMLTLPFSMKLQRLLSGDLWMSLTKNWSLCLVIQSLLLLLHWRTTSLRNSLSLSFPPSDRWLRISSCLNFVDTLIRVASQM